MTFLYQYIKKHYILFFASFFSTLATSMLSIIFVFIVQDALLNPQEIEFTTIFVRFSSILFILSFCVAIRVISTSTMAAKMIHNIRKEIYSKMINIYPYSALKKRIGDVITVLNSDTIVLENCIAIHYPVFLRSAFTTCIGIIMLLISSPMLSIYIGLFIPIVTIIVILLNKRVKLFADKLRSSIDDLASSAESFLSRLQLVQSLNYESKSITIIASLIQNSYRAFIKHSISRAFLITSVILAIFSGVSFIISIGVHDVVNNTVSVSNFGGFVMYLIIVTNSLSGLIESISELSQLKNISERIHELIDEDNTKQFTISIEKNIKKIVFQNTCFSYPNSDTTSLRDFSLEITTKTKIAIVGESGAGKSTIFQLLLGFQHDFTGNILIDDVSITKIEKSSLHDIFSWVPQENMLFPGTIRENILIGNPLASNQEFDSAILNTSISKFLQSLPLGLETKIGINNHNLSYGQKQRISIARAFLKNAPVMLLDEPTSALDALNDFSVMESILSMSRNKTLIMITHKPFYLEEFDKIIFLEKGKILASGTHNELMNTCDDYNKMFSKSKEIFSKNKINSSDELYE